MSLRLVYGRSGAGKSQFLLDEIKNKINEDKKIYIVVPEQFSFSMEQRLLNTVGKGSIINAEVLTLSRMGTRVISELGKEKKSKLSKIGKAMIIYSCIQNLKNNINFLNDSDKNLDLVLRTITEFRKHSITVENIKEVLNKTEDNYLKLKLNDIYMILEKYDYIIRESFIDESDILDLLIENLDYTDMFNDTLIYIDEFMGFTIQEYKIIEKLIKISNMVTITICADELNYDLIDMSDIFYFNKQVANKLIAIAHNNNFKIEKSIELTENKRIKSEELKFLEQNLYTNKTNTYLKNTNDIHIFMAKNPYSEVEYIASKILELVRDKNARYRDVGIICKNIEDYSFNIKAIFKEYNIPVFIDEKKDVNNNILMIYIVSLLNIIIKNWSYESVFSFLKTGLVDIENKDIYELENYVIKWGVKNSKWYKEDFYYEEKNDLQDKINESRKKIVSIVREFKEIINTSKKVKDIAKGLVDFINRNNISIKIYDMADVLEEKGLYELSSEYRNSLKIFYDVLDEMVLIFDEEEMNFDKFNSLLQIGLSKSEFGIIPSTLDQVVFGDIDRTRIGEVKYLFILGMNDGIIPSIIKNEGFLNDSDREFLKENGLDVAKGTIEQLYENQFNLYKIFSNTKEKLYLSYPISDKDGKTLRHSVLITKIRNIFKNIRQSSDVINKDYKITLKESTFDDAISKYKNYLDTGKIEDKWIDVLNWYYINDNERFMKVIKAIDYTNQTTNISRKNVENLYGNTMKTSISRLEQYRRCPFSFHLKYGLKIKEPENFEIRSIDTGSFMHDVIDTFFKYIQEKEINIDELDEETLKKVIYDIIEEKLNMSKNYIFTSTPKYIVLTKRLAKVVYESITYLVEQLRNSKFKVHENEIEFKDSSKYKPIVIELSDNKKVELTGKIDRVDIAEIDNKKYVRIIDYKSSVKDLDLNQVICGLQIQLVSYLDAITENEEINPAGILYFNLIDTIIKNSKNIPDEEIKEKIRKMYKMKGLIVADIDIIKAMDTRLEKGFSDTIPVYLDKEGNISKNRSSAISKKDFENLQRYSKKIIKEISTEIINGNIPIKPFYMNKKTGCDYCKYKSICGFDINNNENNYNYISSYDKDYVLDMIKEEGDKNNDK